MRDKFSTWYIVPCTCFVIYTDYTKLWTIKGTRWEHPYFPSINDSFNNWTDATPAAYITWPGTQFRFYDWVGEVYVIV